MSRDAYLHELDEFSDLIRIIASEKDIVPQLVEKDYWIMHCLYGLSTQGFEFELKGGTSLSKGYGIINRFSEDIDLHISPGTAPFDVDTNPRHKKTQHVESRKKFYDWLAEEISIVGVTHIERDTEFDDDLYRSGGIRLFYDSRFEEKTDLKEGILLEVGFDDTTPNKAVTITSWALDKAQLAGAKYLDNRAVDVKCYHPGYTFVEKLQTVSTKFRKQQASGEFSRNFMRHYYDISQLLGHPDVQGFIGTDDYQERK
ncbi:hypothetical protein MNBD_GAMMA15-2115 [hydrothermal vent metagenome]|uniref:Nucleotidyl transferase AbiEii toxin, Type IV TA system n=1 Tax=hydrothermal vent metagenome TaxID=652676 RepID=A0A3B0YFI8_9ZZZZ